MSDGVSAAGAPAGTGVPDATGVPDGASATDGMVGLVAGTEDSTPLLFRVAVAPDAYLQLDDVVVTRRDVPGFGLVSTAGRGHRGQGPARRRHVRLRRLPDQRRRAAGPGAGDRRDHHHPGRAGVLRPAAPRDAWPSAPPAPTATRRCTSTRCRPKLPIGLGRDGEPIYVNLEFLDGTRGAHVSICGISGVATKTSFALFLLHSALLLRRARQAAAERQGADLLRQGRGPAVPRPAEHPAGRRAARQVRRPSVCRPTPFASVGFFAPPMPGDQTGRPHVTGRTSGVSAFWWTLAEFCRDELLPYVFADVEDERNQYTMVVHQVATRLRLDAAAGRQGRRRSRSTADGPHLAGAGRPDRRPAHRRRHPGRLGRPGDRHRHGQRVHPPAAVIGPAAEPDPARRPDRHLGPEHRHQPTSRSPSSTCTTCRSARSDSWSAWCSPPRPPARRRPGRAGCCSP